MLSPAAFAASATDKDPSAWIVELMNDTLNDIRKDPALVKADPTKVHTFVNNRIMPVVDFAKMTRTAVGPPVASGHRLPAPAAAGWIPQPADARLLGRFQLREGLQG